MYDTIAVNGEEQHTAKSVIGLTSETVSDAMDWEVDLIRELQGPEGTGLTLEMSEAVSDLIRNGEFPFTLEKHLKGHFGESMGSSNVTTVRLKENMNLDEVLEQLAATGQLESARKVIEEYRWDSDPSAEVILTYALAQYAKGWLAEEIIETADWFKKSSVSADKGGIDGYAHGEETQIKSITCWNSQKSKIENSSRRHLMYQWDARGNLHIADSGEEALEMNKKVAKEAGLSATLIRKSAGSLKVNEEVGRSFRYLWW